MARRKGYRNYYEYRTLYDNGRIAPDAAPLPKGSRTKSRGHRGRADFLAFLKRGYTISLVEPVSNIEVVERKRKGELVKVYPRIDKLVIDNKGIASRWVLRNLTRAQLVETIRAERRKGAVFVPAPSLDQQRLVTERELKAEGAK